MTNWPAGEPGAPLSDAQFAAALRRGMGRAVLQAKRGLSEAQLAELRRWYATTPAHDAQIEDQRAPQILEMASIVGDVPTLRGAVLHTLNDEHSEQQWHCARHLYWLAESLAEQGDEEARDVLIRSFERNAAGRRYIGAFGLVAAKGFDGLVRVATILGGDLPEEEHERTQELVEALAQSAAEQSPDSNQEQESLRIRHELESVAATNPRVAEFVRVLNAWLEKIETPPESTDPVAGPLFTDLLRLADEQGPPPLGTVIGWRDAASAEQMDAAANHLEQCRDRAAFRTYMRIFLGDFSEWPLPLDTLLKRAADPIDPCRRWVQTVLEAQTDPRVGELARRLIQVEPVSRDALDMLRLHATPADVALIERALGRRVWKDDDDLHEVALALTSFGANSDDPAWNGLLRWHYEMTPCSFCRAKSFELLLERDAADADLRAEAHHDADDGTRELAQSSAE